MSDKATGILTERYDHGSAVVRCGVDAESRAAKAMEYRDMMMNILYFFSRSMSIYLILCSFV